ncbi:MAG: hypothetical protein LBD76_01825 [Prevotellaceae bacterium]|jgi:hypothetical protein|nr:hypothetical protein [Prevotellaceae bacterium]
MIIRILLNMVIGLVVATIAGFSPIAGAIGLGVAGFIPQPKAALATIYREVWTGEQIKAFRTSVESIGWLNAITSYDQYVRAGNENENDVIHLVAVGADPEVLLNNTTYPIPVQSLTDADVAISLDKYQTKATRVTDDELHAISYDKMSSVIERHRDAVNETKYRKAIHALAPQSSTANTPVVATNGAKNVIVKDVTRNAMLRQDIIALKVKFDVLKIPLQGRILVLCPDHVADLLGNDQKFSEQYYNYTSGKISNLYGFQIYEYQSCPYFSITAAKLAWGAVPAVTDTQASVAFYAPLMFKATGRTITYPTPAEATNQEHLYNLRHYFVCLPKQQKAIGAIVSAVEDDR